MQHQRGVTTTTTMDSSTTTTPKKTVTTCVERAVAVWRKGRPLHSGSQVAALRNLFASFGEAIIAEGDTSFVAQTREQLDSIKNTLGVVIILIDTPDMDVDIFKWTNPTAGGALTPFFLEQLKCILAAYACIVRVDGPFEEHITERLESATAIIDVATWFYCDRVSKLS